jgi:hypothetical protein
MRTADSTTPYEVWRKSHESCPFPALREPSLGLLSSKKWAGAAASRRFAHARCGPGPCGENTERPRTARGYPLFRQGQGRFHREPHPGKRTFSPELPIRQDFGKVRFRTPSHTPRTTATNSPGRCHSASRRDPWACSGAAAPRARKAPFDHAVNGYNGTVWHGRVPVRQPSALADYWHDLGTEARGAPYGTAWHARGCGSLPRPEPPDTVWQPTARCSRIHAVNGSFGTLLHSRSRSKKRRQGTEPRPSTPHLNGRPPAGTP